LALASRKKRLASFAGRSGGSNFERPGQEKGKWSSRSSSKGKWEVRRERGRKKKKTRLKKRRFAFTTIKKNGNVLATLPSSRT